MVMSTLVQMERGRASRWIIGELWETLSPHIPMFQPGKSDIMSGKPHMAMKLQPRDTAPHASRPVSAQRGELLGKYTENEPPLGITQAVFWLKFIYLFSYFHRMCQKRFL